MCASTRLRLDPRLVYDRLAPRMSRPNSHGRPDPVTGAELISADEARVGEVIDGRYRLDALLGKAVAAACFRRLIRRRRRASRKACNSEDGER